MKPTGVKANLSVPDISQAREFYADYLGLSVEEFNMGWVARFRSPDGRAAVQLVTRDATAPYDSAISVHVGDGVPEHQLAGEVAAQDRQRRDATGRPRRRQTTGKPK